MWPNSHAGRSRHPSGVVSPTTFALRPLTGLAVDTFVHTASTKGLLLTWSADDALAGAHVGDPLRIRQIISNFLSNAVKFTEVGGIEVTVRVVDASAEAQTVEIAVTDTGIGVPVEHQRRLFAEFAQAEAGTAQRFGGTGLGLVICKRLAVLMGGDVTLESAPGVGTTMRLTVPMPIGDPAAVEAASELHPGAPATTRAKPTREQAEREGSVLLLAEDHPVNRTVLTHQLDLAGFHVDTAVDGQEAFERFLSGGYALILTDSNMPRMDGYELARAIRGHERQTGLERTPIVALTANVMQGEPAKCARGRDGRLRGQADDDPGARLEAAALAPRARMAGARAAATAGEASRGAALDDGVLDELTGGDPAFAASLLADFVETSRSDLRALDDAIAARDHDAARTPGAPDQGRGPHRRRHRAGRRREPDRERRRGRQRRLGRARRAAREPRRAAHPHRRRSALVAPLAFRMRSRCGACVELAPWTPGVAITFGPGCLHHGRHPHTEAGIQPPMTTGVATRERTPGVAAKRGVLRCA